MLSQANSTRIHEAGHAVIGCVLGVVISEIRIHPDPQPGEGLGVCVFEGMHATLHGWRRLGLHHRRLSHAIRANILMAMAGTEAERTILGRSSGGDSYDRAQIAALYRELAAIGALPEDHERKFRRNARLLVRRHRDTIQNVAQALQRRGTMRGGAIDQFVSIARSWGKLAA